MTPEHILNKVIDTYASMESYSDVGTVDRVPPIGQTSLEFKTFFAKPNNMRFEWRSWHPHFGKDEPANESVVWSNGDQSHMWFLGKLRHYELVSAVAGAFGVSSMSVAMISNLFLAERLEYRGEWTTMRDIKMLSDENIGNFCCYHLVGSTEEPDDKEAWVSKEDFVVRRLRTLTGITEAVNAQRAAMLEQMRQPSMQIPIKKKCAGQQFYLEYNYTEVAVNQPLPDDLFNYDPDSPPDPRYVR
jgi:outer membrane lipoprotein-sorting protein